jgi:alkanesulfonate monooxygenase SsuD/methylene tetrahydromethanopterin reductase-like flavin-dependent oxidoreductase (luciferase family)
MPISPLFDHIEIHGGRPIKEVYEADHAPETCGAGGFYAFHLAEYHGHDYSSPSQPVFCRRWCAETTTLKLIPTVAASRCITRSDLRGLRCSTSFGRAARDRRRQGITPFEHLFFGHELDEASDRTRDILDMLLTGWETGIMSSANSKYYDFIEFQLPWQPIQHPYPPLWTAGNVETAGRGGHNFIFPVPVPAEMKDRYHELRTASREEPGHQNPRHQPWIAQSQALVIAETDAERSRSPAGQ